MISNYLFAKQVYYVYTYFELLLAYPTIFAASVIFSFSDHREDTFHEVAIAQLDCKEKKLAQSNHLSVDNHSDFSVHKRAVENFTQNCPGTKLHKLVYAPLDTNIYLLLIGVIIYGYILLRDEKRIKFK